MNDELHSESDFNEQSSEEIGSDELLSANNLRLPEAANILVRLHALRAWLARRRSEASLEVGEAALAWQAAIQQAQQGEPRPRRRARHEGFENNSTGLATSMVHAQAQLQEAQASLAAFDEAQELLEECIAHTQGERVLVEYYLLIEQRLLDAGYTPTMPNEGQPSEHAPWFEVMAEVLRRVEHVGIPEEE